MKELRRILTLGARLALVLAALAVPARPQEAAPDAAPVGLVADRVSYDAEARLLTAEGNVEAFYEGRVLRASRITYDEAAGEIRAAGPITLTDPDGAVLLADSAALTPELTEGLIRGARLLVSGRLQLAATEVRRTGGRFDTLYRTVASSCEICAENPTPTWAIRAARVTEDRETRQIYFENARLEVFGLPVAWLPWLRIPDPSLARASGFLVPGFRNSDIYGFGARVPYYRVLGPQADATVAPFVTTGGAAILEGEYRHRFARGGFDLSGAIAFRDGIEGGGARGFLTSQGAFALARGFVADFDLNITSDDSFLRQFDYSDADRLTSFVRVSRTRLADYTELGAVAFQSLRQGEETGQVPIVLPEFTYRRLVPTPAGRIGLDLRGLGLLRDDGRDLLRGGLGLDWRRDATLARGLLAAGFAAADADFYRIRDEAAFAEARSESNLTATLGAELRWPWARSGPGATHVIEPMAQLLYTGNRGEEDVPNEDSQLPEFDETNLFALNRFPGIDRVETGLRANLGLGYLRHDPVGWTLGATLGRSFRVEEEDVDLLGLGGRSSDWVAAVSLEAGGLWLVNRSLFDTDLDFRRNELELAYAGRMGALGASHVYLAADDSNPLLGAVPETNEVTLDGRWRVARNWELRAAWRYDIANESNIRALGGVTYGNECAELDLSVSRRYTASDNVPPATSVGFSLRLTGLGTEGNEDWPPRACRG